MYSVDSKLFSTFYRTVEISYLFELNWPIHNYSPDSLNNNTFEQIKQLTQNANTNFP